MTVVVPSLLSHPAGEGRPRIRRGRGGREQREEEKKKSDRERDSERILGKDRTNERRSSKVEGWGGGWGSPQGASHQRVWRPHWAIKWERLCAPEQAEWAWGGGAWAGLPSLLHPPSAPPDGDPTPRREQQSKSNPRARNDRAHSSFSPAPPPFLPRLLLVQQDKLGCQRPSCNVANFPSQRTAWQMLRGGRTDPRSISPSCCPGEDSRWCKETRREQGKKGREGETR